jgi:hypothetical protein
LEPLREQVSLQFLKLSIPSYPNGALHMICELVNLETLELRGQASNSSGLDKIRRLGKLKKLVVDWGLSEDILSHLQLGVFNDLEELDGYFYGSSQESIQEMKKIAPNLRKISVWCNSSNTINALLEALADLENLETLKIREDVPWQIPSNKHYPRIKHLDIYCQFSDRINVDQFAKTFPNLESLNFYKYPFELTEVSLIRLLGGLKQIRKLSLTTTNVFCMFDSVVALQCFRDYGKNLEQLIINDIVFTRLVGVSSKIVPGFDGRDPGKQGSVQKML